MDLNTKEASRKREARGKGPTRLERQIVRWRKLMEWDGRSPLPRQIAMMKATKEFRKVKALYGGICTSPGCGGRSVDQHWHFAPKCDPLRWQSHTEAAYQRILRYPEEYDMVCGNCAIARHLATVAWVWQDNPPQTTEATPKSLAYSRSLIEAAYPRDQSKLLELVNCGKIKAFVGFQARVKYKFMTPQMKEIFAAQIHNTAFLKLHPIYKNIRNGYRKLLDEELWPRSMHPDSTPLPPRRELSPIERFYF